MTQTAPARIKTSLPLLVDCCVLFVSTAVTVAAAAAAVVFVPAPATVAVAVLVAAITLDAAGNAVGGGGGTELMGLALSRGSGGKNVNFSNCPNSIFQYSNWRQ